MAVNTILVDTPTYYGESGGKLEFNAHDEYLEFVPAVGDKVLVKNTDFWYPYDPLLYGDVTDIYITDVCVDAQAAEYNAAVHTTIGPQLYNLLASSTGVEFTVTAIAADPDDAGKQLLTLQAPLLDKAVGLDGARFIRDKIKAKQDKLTAGTNISIAADGKTISATDTTYSDFTGATSSVAGANGLVPAPTTSDPDKFLKGDGTWGTISSNDTVYYINNPLEDLSTFSIYTDNTLTTTVDAQTLHTAFLNGRVIIRANVSGYRNNAYELINVSYDADDAAYGFVLTDYWADFWFGGGANITSFILTKMGKQRTLTAGTNVNIDTTDAYHPVISATDTTYSNFAGATSSVAGAAGLVPAPAAGDEAKALHGDGTWKDTTAKLVEMSYGEANAWAKFIAAYNAGSIVYCRASSNANPGTGSQTRKAFMAYVNNATNPTNVEFQYVRSQSSKTDSQQTDQVFVYTLTNASGGTWSVASRNMGPKIVAGTGMSSTFTTGANATITLNAEPNYSTSEVDTKVKWIDGKTIYRKTINYGTLPDTNTQFVNHNISSLGNVIKIEGFMTEGTVWRTLPYADGSFDSVYVTSTQVGIYTTADMTAWSAYVTLYYTKSS